MELKQDHPPNDRPRYFPSTRSRTYSAASTSSEHRLHFWAEIFKVAYEAWCGIPASVSDGRSSQGMHLHTWQQLDAMTLGAVKCSEELPSSKAVSDEVRHLYLHNAHREGDTL